MFVCDRCKSETHSSRYLGENDRVCDSCYAQTRPDKYQCPCGKWEYHSHYRTGTLKKNKENQDLCFMCSFWWQHLQNYLMGNSKVVIVDGVHYTIGDEVKDPFSFRGFGGRKFQVQFIDGRKNDKVITTNMWHQGPIPDNFRDKMPDNATFADGVKWVQVGDVWCLSH